MNQSKRAIVTGASRGIGKAVATALLEDGYELLLVAKTSETLSQATQELQKLTSTKVHSLTCNLEESMDSIKVRDFCLDNRFYPTVLVNNAGIFIEGSLSASSTEDFDLTMATNLRGMYCLTKNLIPLLKKVANARILIIGSTASLEPYPTGAIYGVSKWATRGYAHNLRQELKSDGIGVTLITPGGTLTDLWAGEVLPEARLLNPKDIADMIVASLNLSKQAVVEEMVIRPMLGDVHE